MGEHKLEEVELITTTYLGCIIPIFFSVNETIALREAKSRDISEINEDDISRAKSAKSFAFEFFDVLRAITKDGKLLESKQMNFSNKIFLPGQGVRAYTLDQVLEEYPYETDMIRNMRENLIEVVSCVDGEFRPFKEGDTIIDL